MEEATCFLEPAFFKVFREFHSSCLQYKHLIRTCQEPGLNIYGGNPPTSREALTRAPGAPQSPRKKPRKTVIFIGGVWEFDTLHAAGIPGFHVPKTADFCDLLLGEFDAA